MVQKTTMVGATSREVTERVVKVGFGGANAATFETRRTKRKAVMRAIVMLLCEVWREEVIGDCCGVVL
jgi:hypothetical protein